MNQLASLIFSWLLGLMEDHICVRWWNMKYPLKYLIKCWRNLLKKLQKIPRWIRVSKANQFQTLDDFLIKITYKDHEDSYMMLRAILNQFLIELLALRVLNPIFELDRSKVSMCPTYKRVRLYKDIFLVFWLVDKEKKSIIQPKMLGDLSQCKPNEWGVGRMLMCDPNAYDEIAWGILGSKLGSYSFPYLRTF